MKYLLSVLVAVLLTAGLALPAKAVTPEDVLKPSLAVGQGIVLAIAGPNPELFVVSWAAVGTLAGLCVDFIPACEAYGNRVNDAWKTQDHYMWGAESTSKAGYDAVKHTPKASTGYDTPAQAAYYTYR